MRPGHRTPVLWRVAFYLLSLSSTSFLAVAQSKIEPRWNLFKEEQDVEIGRQSAAEAEKDLKLINDPQIVGYVNAMAKRLVAKSQGPDYPYTFKVVDDGALNAFALPGGPIYLNRGVLESARNDGEVAGVLAHEISHVVLRHGTANVSKQQLSQTGLGLLGGLLGQKVGQSTAQLINAAGGFGLNTLFLKYSRSSETEADLYGAQILSRAGYNPRDMVGFFETLDAQTKASGGKTSEWMSSHPAPENRIEKIEEEAKLLKVKPGRTETNELAEIQAKLGKLPVAGKSAAASKSAALSPAGSDAAKEGLAGSAKGTSAAPAGAAAGVRTSAGTLTRTAPQIAAPAKEMSPFSDANLPYKISYPSNWTVYKSGRTGVAFAPEGGTIEAEGKASLLCGAIVNKYQPFGNDVEKEEGEEAANVSIERAYGDVRSMVLQGNPHLTKVEGSGKRFRLPDGSRKGVTLRGTHPRTGIVERVSVVATQTKQGVVYMLFMAPDDQAEKFDSALDAMVASLGSR